MLFALRRTTLWAVPCIGLVIFCLLLGHLGLLPNWLYDSICLVMAVVFFVIAIPLGLFFRLDRLPQEWGFDQGMQPVVLSLTVALLNLFLLYFLRSFLQTRAEATVQGAPQQIKNAKITVVEKSPGKKEALPAGSGKKQVSGKDA